MEAAAEMRSSADFSVTNAPLTSHLVSPRKMGSYIQDILKKMSWESVNAIRGEDGGEENNWF